MIYNKVNSKIIIARIFDSYNLDYTGFVPRVPAWLYQALRFIRVSDQLNASIVIGTVVDYKCAIPAETYELVAVSYNGFRLPRIDVLNENVSTDMINLTHPMYKYQLDNNGNIITTFATGTIKFYIKSFPSELDTNTGLYFPLIADNEDLFDALEKYVLLKIIQRGHNINGLSLRENNEFTNPGIAWKIAKKRATNSLMSFDNDDREIVSQLIRTLVVDYDNYVNGVFNNTNLVN